MIKLLLVDPRNIEKNGRIKNSSNLNAITLNPNVNIADETNKSVADFIRRINMVLTKSQTPERVVISLHGYCFATLSSLPSLVEYNFLGNDNNLLSSSISWLTSVMLPFGHPLRVILDNSITLDLSPINSHVSEIILSEKNMSAPEDTPLSNISDNCYYKGIFVSKSELVKLSVYDKTIEEHYQTVTGFTRMNIRALPDSIVGGDSLGTDIQFIVDKYETETCPEFEIFKFALTHYNYVELSSELINLFVELMERYGGVPYTSEDGSLALFNALS